MDLNIRRASSHEISWINKKYDEVQFIHSDFSKEIIAIAEVGFEKAGLGRIVTLDEKNLELGGIYVFDSFRNKGIATKIIEFLLPYCLPTQNIYCIPFSNLTKFYQHFGFVPCTEYHQIPKAILDKCKWCRESQKAMVEVLILPATSQG